MPYSAAPAIRLRLSTCIRGPYGSLIFEKENEMSIKVIDETKGQFTGRHMLFLLVGFFAIIFLMNLVLTYFALGSWSGLLVRNGYDASQTYNQQIEQAREQDLLCWRSPFGTENGAGILRIVDRSGQPVRGLDITVAAARPTNEKEDRMLEFSENADGSYRGEAALSDGNWIISILAEDTSTARIYRRRFRIFIQPAGNGS